MGSALVVEETSAATQQYLFEPDPATVFQTILPQYVNNILWQMLLEARASEHSSRMVAMKNATDNAKQMLKDLSLEYNKLRQAAITNELLEITTAKMALG
jgi:F-type H+-transporting ATPase subunit gamma